LAHSHSGNARSPEVIEEEVFGHAKAPREERDAILGHVASWGEWTIDKTIPLPLVFLWMTDGATHKRGGAMQVSCRCYIPT